MAAVCFILLVVSFAAAQCASNPCRNGGTCNEACVCVSGYGGVSCDSNACTSNPCQNEGTCVGASDGGFSCVCGGSFTGDHCENCHPLIPCAFHPCLNSGTCVTGVCGHNFTCECMSGYNGLTCETDLNECVSSPCEHNGTCIDHVNGYECQCTPGYTGVTCHERLLLNNSSNSPCFSFPCQHSATCKALNSTSFVCNCTKGYQGQFCQTDIDECGLRINPCPHAHMCRNTDGGFVCPGSRIKPRYIPGLLTAIMIMWFFYSRLNGH